MKARNILHVVFASVAALLGFLLLLAYVVPFVKSGSGTGSAAYLMSFAGYSSTSSSSTSVNFFYSVLIAIFGCLGLFLLVVKDKPLFHDFGIAFTAANALYAITLHQAIKTMLASYSSSSSVNISHPGEIIFFIYAILGLILSLGVLLDDLFGETVFQKLSVSEKPSKEKRLTELKDLLDKQLVTPDEYEAKRKEILDEK